ncbi:MAG: DUF2207 domain-containing protein [Patescibacteria group bacterium]
MRRWLLIAAFILFPWPALAQGNGGEHITNFRAELTVRPDRTIQVVEHIAYDFANVSHHGIYRDLPVTYKKSGQRFTVRYDIQRVTDGVSTPQPYKLQHPSGQLRIRIGDPDVTVTGAHTYIIQYTVKRALPQFDGQDEVYWNVTGNGWDVPIAVASATLTLHNDAEALQPSCYTGVLSSTAQDCTVKAGEHSVVTFSAEALATGEGLTIAARLPAGTVATETTQTRVGYFVQDNWIVLLPLLALIIMHWQWHKRGRDPKGRGTVIPQYESPRGMFPAVVGAVADNQVGAKEFAATILHLAIRGYLSIQDLGQAGMLGNKHNYEFTRRKAPDQQLQAYEKTLLEGLFKDGTVVTTQSLKYKFATTYQAVIADARNQLVTQGVYARDPRMVQAASIGLGLLGVGTCLLFAILQQGTLLVVPFLAALGSALIVVIYGLLMPARTKLGAEILEEVQGFTWFLSVTEAERLKFHNAPARKPEQFMEFLPYAVALGVEKEWAGQFADLAIPQPGWYSDNLGTFNALLFANSIGGFSSDVHSALATAPSSSGAGGGGFSGGGFGGGGGGGW